jgi:hypothetical protein
MIWIEDHEPVHAESAFCHAVYHRLIRASDADEQEKQSLREVARALARVWSDDLNRRLSSDRLFSLLGSQACWSLGHRGLAERLVAGLSMQPFESRAVLDLIRSGRLTVRTGTGLAMRLIRPSERTTDTPHDIWILDMPRIFGPSLWSLDLLLTPRLRRVLEQLCELWDPTLGEGVLVLEMSETKSENPPHAALLDVARYCVLVLERVRDRRNWIAAPEVRIQQATPRKSFGDGQNM